MNAPNSVESIPLWLIVPSRWQPRDAQFDEERLIGLANSIKTNGLINPVLIFGYPDADGYTVWELVAGERRTRASIAISLADALPENSLEEWARYMAHVGLVGLCDDERAALHKADAQILGSIAAGDDLKQLHVLAVIENLDREGLTPVEEGRAYQRLQEAEGWSQRELAAQLHKSQGYVAQRLALVDLPAVTQEAVNTRVISFTAARAIAALPAAAQAPMTTWATAAVSDEAEEPATARQVEKHIRSVRTFLDPERWQPNGERVYRPAERNRLALIAAEVESVELTDERVQALLKLSSFGMWTKNILILKPVQIAENEGYTLAVLDALTGGLGIDETDFGGECDYMVRAGKSCENCIWQGIIIPNDLGLFRTPCPDQIPDSPIEPSCIRHIGTDDPVVIPIGDWHMCRAVAAQSVIDSVKEPFLHVTSVNGYREIYRQAVALKNQERVASKTKTSTRHVDEIQAYYEWQASLPAEWRAHFQAHACEKCSNYLGEGDPPCLVASAPIKRRGWGDNEYAPRFGCLVAEDGQLAPRCEAFVLRSQNGDVLAGLGDEVGSPISLLTVGRTLPWIERVMLSVKSSNNYEHVLWGPLCWLDYGQTPGWGEVHWTQLKKWLLAYWEELGDRGIAHLLDVAISEIDMLTHTDAYAIELINANDGQRMAWRHLRWPFDSYRKHDYNIPSKWPDDWAKPWVIEEESETP